MSVALENRPKAKVAGAGNVVIKERSSRSGVGESHEIHALDDAAQVGTSYASTSLLHASIPKPDPSHIATTVTGSGQLTRRRGFSNAEMAQLGKAEVETLLRTELAGRGLGESKIGEMVATARSVVDYHASTYNGESSFVRSTKIGPKKSQDQPLEEGTPITQIQGVREGTSLGEKQPLKPLLSTETMPQLVAGDTLLTKGDLLEALRSERGQRNPRTATAIPTEFGRGASRTMEALAQAATEPPLGATERPARSVASPTQRQSLGDRYRELREKHHNGAAA